MNLRNLFKSRPNELEIFEKTKAIFDERKEYINSFSVENQTKKARLAIDEAIKAIESNPTEESIAAFIAAKRQLQDAKLYAGMDNSAQYSVANFMADGIYRQAAEKNQDAWKANIKDLLKRLKLDLEETVKLETQAKETLGVDGAKTPRRAQLEELIQQAEGAAGGSWHSQSMAEYFIEKLK